MRLEVIDHTESGRGRVLTMYDVQVRIDLQDDGQTMKVFLTDGD